MTILNPPRNFDFREELPDRIAQRAKCAAINTPVEYDARDPSRQTNNSTGQSEPGPNDALWLSARGAR